MYFVKVEKGVATKRYFNFFGKFRVKKFMIFLDNEGAYIKERRNKVYLTDKNCISF